MFVMMNTSVVEDLSALQQGQTYDLPDKRARKLIATGQAEAIGPSSPQKKPARSA